MLSGSTFASSYSLIFTGFALLGRRILRPTAVGGQVSFSYCYCCLLLRRSFCLDLRMLQCCTVRQLEPPRTFSHLYTDSLHLSRSDHWVCAHVLFALLSDAYWQMQLFHSFQRQTVGSFCIPCKISGIIFNAVSIPHINSNRTSQIHKDTLLKFNIRAKCSM